MIWAEPRPRADRERNEYWDVIPIPFYPPDLPDIEWNYLTQQQRKYVVEQLWEMLFPQVAAA